MPSFSWTVDAKVAEREQGSLRQLLRLATTLSPDLEFDQGIAIGTAYDENTKKAFACGVTFNQVGHYRAGHADMAVKTDVDFPYVPGLLAYRVGPAVCRLLDKVIDEVDVILLDGQGIAHQRGFGLAAHIGVLYDKPSVGITRNNLFGLVHEPSAGRFNRTAIIHPQTNEVLGHALSLGDACSPCYVSPGHRMTVDDATRLVCQVAGTSGCFPKALNRAHARANAAAKSFWRRTQPN